MFVVEKNLYKIALMQDYFQLKKISCNFLLKKQKEVFLKATLTKLFFGNSLYFQIILDFKWTISTYLH